MKKTLVGVLVLSFLSVSLASEVSLSRGGKVAFPNDWHVVTSKLLATSSSIVANKASKTEGVLMPGAISIVESCSEKTEKWSFCEKLNNEQHIIIIQRKLKKSGYFQVYNLVFPKKTKVTSSLFEQLKAVNK